MTARAFTVTMLGALLAVLTLAPTAGAECAWVLWLTIRELDGRGGEDVSILEAYTTKKECDQAESRERADLKKEPVKYRYRVICLPDTVDPRGPKGGGR